MMCLDNSWNIVDDVLGDFYAWRYKDETSAALAENEWEAMDDAEYLYPDASVHANCHINDDYSGWYKTRQEAQEAIDKYNSKG